MNIYSKMKHKILSGHPDVIEDYTKYINNYGNKTLSQKARAYTYLAGLLMHRGKNLKKIEVGEFEDCKRRSMSEWKEILKNYDVISFDCFDTLVLRCVDHPEDVFDFVGAKLKIEDFRRIRRMAEDKTAEHNRYYSIHEIYRRMKRYIGVDPEEGALTEYKMERALSIGNPYMKELVALAKEMGKKVIVISDTYFTQEQIEELLRRCGYEAFDAVYTSLNLKQDKKSGEIYEVVKKDFTEGTRILHIGDNLNSDVDCAEKNGISAWHYDSVFAEGKSYRPGHSGEDLTRSVKNALINNEVHNGITDMSPLEQYGFIYGGSLVAGFCDYLERIAREYRFDSMIFLSRDARVFYDNYRDFYDYTGEPKVQYAYVSRAVMLKLLIADYPSLYVNKVLKQYAFTGKLKVSDVLSETELMSLLPELETAGIYGDSLFTTKNLPVVEQFIYKYKERLAIDLAEQKEAAKKYWIEMIGDSKRVLLVDDGLHGTIFVCLERFLRETCGLSVELYSAQLGTLKDSFNQRLFTEGKMLSYGFASDQNVDLAALFANGIEVSTMESFLSEDIGSLKAYTLSDSGNVGLFYYPANSNGEYIRKIQAGIHRFVSAYIDVKHNAGISLYIEGPTAFEEMLQIIQSPKYMDNLLGDYIYTSLPGVLDSEKTMHDWYVQERCI